MTPDEQLELLRQFAPTLHFDALERWRPTLVDAYLQRSAVLDDREHALPGTPPAEPAIRNHPSDRKMRLNPLRNDSDLNTQLRSAEMLDAYGSEQSLAGGGEAYGRVTPAAGGDLFLQYWLFYPDNPCVLPPGRHDGDWELVQVKVEPRGEAFAATQVTLAEHGKPTTRSIETAKADRGPDVFVAVDSHACYFEQGAHPALLSDVCDPLPGDLGAKPSVTLLPIAPDKRDWVHWAGRWGLDRGGGTRLAIRLHLKRTTWPLTLLNKAGESPSSPAHQGRSWRFPNVFALAGTRRKWTTVALQRLAHLIGNLTWPKRAPRVTVEPVAGKDANPTRYAIDVGTAGRFLRRASFVSVAFWEARPGGGSRPLAMYSARAGRRSDPIALAHDGELLWRAAPYNFLRQRGEPIESSTQ